MKRGGGAGADLDGALVRLQAQLCVFPLLQDPVQLLREGVVKGRHALTVGLPQQHVAVPVHLPQHAGQRGRQAVGVVHVGQWRRHGEGRGRRGRFSGRKLALACYDLQEAVAHVPKGRHGDGAAVLAAVAVAADGLELEVRASLSLRGPQDLQPLLRELPVPHSPPGAEADVEQHHGQHQAESSQNRHQGDVHRLHVSVRPRLRRQGGGRRRQGLLRGAAGGDHGAAEDHGRLSRGRWLHGEVRVRVYPDGVQIEQHGHRVLQSEAAVGAALLRPSSDDEEAVRADAVARIEAVSHELSAVQGPARGRKVGAQLALEQHVVPRHHRPLPVLHCSDRNTENKRLKLLENRRRSLQRGRLQGGGATCAALPPGIIFLNIP